MNQYPWWKNLLIVAAMAIGALYALPNLYGEDPAVQISSIRGAEVNQATIDDVRAQLSRLEIDVKAMDLQAQGLIVRFNNTEEQLKARDGLKTALQDDGYVVALNLASSTPDWLRSLGALPMYLGLDLRGGVHFLMEVDTDAAVEMAEDRYVGDLRSLMREDKLRYLTIGRVSSGGLQIKFRSVEDRATAESLIHKEFRDLLLSDTDKGDAIFMSVNLSEQEKRETRKLAVQQNVTTLRNRINELGVAEPLIQQQGENRIVVQLPGVQDTARAKEILGATATLDFRMADETGNVQDALDGRVPVGSRLFKERATGNPVLLQKNIIITGDSIVGATATIDQRDASPAVSISLDSKGGSKMHDITKENVGKLMAVVYVESKSETRIVDGVEERVKSKVEDVISLANIREPFGKSFQITGLESKEASYLALLLRAGALSAPLEIIEERTVGPSLGQDNIDMGMKSMVIGFVVVMTFMVLYYRAFGMIANVTLVMNLVLLTALLSMLQATLTLPGIAGIVLTIGMAVDANVLIYERIREELRNGNSPQASIHAGFERAAATIADSNITTLIAGITLFWLGSGPVKGFAVVLCLGILTSMFTAILGTRALVNLAYGGRRVNKLSI
ncbi:MAG: protein translocase subunit SecD [Pseudomonadota bacterium]|nr:protein translocase subunit SecD [Pseudomonadota bacterium]